MFQLSSCPNLINVITINVRDNKVEHDMTLFDNLNMKIGSKDVIDDLVGQNPFRKLFL